MSLLYHSVRGEAKPHMAWSFSLQTKGGVAGENKVLATLLAPTVFQAE